MRRARSSDLKRKPASREPKTRFTIFCEGKNTEPAYLAAIRRIHPDSIIDIDIIPEAGVPYTQAQSAIRVATERGFFKKRKESFERNDQFWVVFDRDDHPRFEESVALCEAKKIHAARSNPCFELWLILHYQDYDKPSDRHQVQSHLQTIDPKYDAKGRKLAACDSLVANLETAERRAEAQITRRAEENSHFGPPSTTMHLLTRAIRHASQKSRP
jgi:hypothetical protein